MDTVSFVARGASELDRVNGGALAASSAGVLCSLRCQHTRAMQRAYAWLLFPVLVLHRECVETVMARFSSRILFIWHVV